MKTNLLKSILAGAALLVGTVASAQVNVAENVKYYLGVTGYNQNGAPSTVSTTVYEGFGFDVQMPLPENQSPVIVGADIAKIDMVMQNTWSLGTGGTIRQHSVTIDTKVKGTYVDLLQMLSSVYHFQGVSSEVTVIDAPKTAKFTYSISGIDNNGKIVGTPSTYEDASAAWKIITNNVTSITKTENDSYFIAKAGSYFQLGDERIEFKEDVDLVTGTFDLDKILNQVEDLSKVKLVKGVASGEDTYKGIFYLPAGSTFAVSNSLAILDKAATITVDLRKLYEGKELTGVLSENLKKVATAGDKSKYMAVLLSINLFNQLVGMVDAADRVPIEVRFTPVETVLRPYHVDIDGNFVYGGEQSVESFQVLLNEYPNAVAELVSGPVPAVKNVIYNENGQFYCDNFVLTDPLPEYASIAKAAYTNFVTPCDFIAKSGNYNRVFAKGYNSICVPFAISTKDDGVNEILTYESYDGNVWATFNSDAKENAAGVPTIITSNGGTFDFTFDNTPIVAEIANGNSTYGTYQLTYKYAEKYFGVNKDINKFAPLNNILAPFRSCLDLNDAAENGIKEVMFKVVETPTAIKNVNAVESNVMYNLNGVKVNNPAGLYITNGKKYFAK